MVEYIEREAICYQLEKQESIDGQPRAIRRARRIVADFPAADVVPVRHGRWTGHDIGNGRLSIDEDTCSLCGSRFYQIAETGCVWHYCPNCGARMDKDGD